MNLPAEENRSGISQLEAFLELLMDLQVPNQTEETPRESPIHPDKTSNQPQISASSSPADNTKDSQASKLISAGQENLPIKSQLKNQESEDNGSNFTLSGNDSTTETAVNGLNLSRVTENTPHQPNTTAPPIIDGDKPDLLNSATDLERLQQLLLSPDLLESRDHLEILRHKFETLERQIYDPTKLINLLLPLITEILSIKIHEDREEMAQVIAPIVDEMIQEKTREDKPAISAALAPVIPDAITKQVLQSPGEFGKAIAPEISGAIKEQIELERDAMVDALYPVIGSTISKYMSEAIAAINHKVENALSPEGIARKIRARMQGISEAELIFKESMPFSIKAIFLIHKASGLVVSEVQPFGKQRLESEMVAGMLTAIRSFVNDCIAQSGEVSELDRIEYGNCEIILEVAGYCYLAVVIQGDPPPAFLDKMRNVMVTIVQRYGQAMELFDGDPANVPEPVHQLLESIIEVRDLLEKQKRKFPVALLILCAAVTSAIFIPWGIHNYQNKLNQKIAAKTSLALASDPELAVYHLQVGAEGGIIELSGKLPNEYLVKKAEQIAQTVTPTTQIKNELIAIKVPPDPVLVKGEVERVTSILNHTERMAIWTSYSNGKVTVKGSVIKVADADKITTALEKIPGVESVINTVQLQPLALAARIYFELNSAKLKSSELRKINQIKGFLNDYPNQNLRLIGYSDRSGNPLENQSLALERAKTVAQVLAQQGIDPRRLEISGTTKPPSDLYPDESAQLSRFVEFEAIAR